MKTQSTLTASPRSGILETTIDKALDRWNLMKPQLRHLGKQCFIEGPKILINSRISARCAGWMSMLCAPSLMLFCVFFLPSAIFQDPEQHRFYHFGVALTSHLPVFPMLLSVLCVFVALYLPTRFSAPEPTDRIIL